MIILSSSHFAAWILSYSFDLSYFAWYHQLLGFSLDNANWLLQFGPTWSLRMHIWTVHPYHALVSPTSFRIMAHDCNRLLTLREHHMITYEYDSISITTKLTWVHVCFCWHNPVRTCIMHLHITMQSSLHCLLTACRMLSLAPYGAHDDLLHIMPGQLLHSPWPFCQLLMHESCPAFGPTAFALGVSGMPPCNATFLC